MTMDTQERIEQDHNTRLCVLTSMEDAINASGISCCLSLHDAITEPHRFKRTQAQVTVTFDSGRFDTVTITGYSPIAMMQEILLVF